MNHRNRAIWCAAVAMALAAVWSFSGHAQAQYPPVTGSVTLGAGNTTPDLNEVVAVTAHVLDENGIPVAGVPCVFSVAGQPGDDAAVDAGPFTTDASGNVSTTLMTGSTSGSIAIVASCGDLTAQVSVVAGAAQPPASLPDTGTARQTGDSGLAFWALVVAGAVAGLGGLAIAWRRARA